MPPRYAYWTIIAGGLPTAFRASLREELLPTFQRLREKHPDAEMKWFARGKLWTSPEEARGAGRDADRPREPRGRGWRPGGEHRDPRQQFADAKKARNIERRAQKFERKHGDRDKPDAERPRWRDDKKPGAPRLGDRDARSARPPGQRRDNRPGQDDWRNRDAPRPRDDKPREKPAWRGREATPRGKTTWRPREEKPRDKPDWRARNETPRGKPDWRARDEKPGGKPD